MDERAVARRLWWLLVPAPPLWVVHVIGIRSGWIAPGWGLVLVATALPSLALLVGFARRRDTPVALLVLAGVELAGCGLYAAIVGMAIGLRSL